MAGIRITDKGPLATIDQIVGIKTQGSTVVGLIQVADLEQQLLAGAIGEAIDAAQAQKQNIYTLDLATTANINLTGEQTISGILTSSSKVLVKDKSDPKLNGPYLTGAGAWTRLTDFDTGEELFGQQFYIQSGSNQGKTYGLQNTSVPVVGADDLVYGVTSQQSTAKPAALDALRAKGAPIASASTVDLSTATGDVVTVTGTTAVNSFGTMTAGIERTIIAAADGLVIKASANIMTPAGVPITLMAGDSVIVKSLGSGVWQVVSGPIGQAVPVDAAETMHDQSYDMFDHGIDAGITVDEAGREFHRGGWEVEPESDTLPGQWYDEFDHAIDYLTGAETAAEEEITLPVATDGRTLHRLRAKLASCLFPIGAPTGITRVMFMGDSWTDQNRIMQQIKDLLIAKYGESGFGWIAVDNDITLSRLTGLTFSRANWTYYDATEDGAPVAGIGCAHDGKAIYTTGTTATLSLAVKTQTLKIAYRDTVGGKFRYRVDGGAYTTVTGAGTGNKLFVSITGLTDAVHTIDIDTTVNSGGTTVVLYGFIGLRTAPGIEFHKCGNGSLHGEDVGTYISEMGPFFAEIQPDVLSTILATNDHRLSIPFTTFTAALQGFAASARSAVPDISVILWGPAQCSATAVLPLTDYVAEMYRLSGPTELNCEFFNNHAIFGPFAEANALGQWFDNLHLSDLGGYNASREFGRHFFGL